MVGDPMPVMSHIAVFTRRGNMVNSSACTIYYMYTAGTMFNYMYMYVHCRNNFNLHTQYINTPQGPL